MQSTRNFLIALLLLALLPALAFSQEKTIIDLSQHEARVYSQNGEDGVIKMIFECIGKSTGTYVEFGCESGNECNTRLLREAGWKGLLMDGSWHIPQINLQKEFITKSNINDLFKKHHVPKNLELLSIDIDYNDFYVWQAVDKSYKPDVVVIEYNATHLPHEDKIVLYHPTTMWDGTNYFGGSLLAMFNLGRSKGYSLVYAESRGVNLFFIRDDLLEQIPYTFLNTNNVQALYRVPSYGSGPNGGHQADPKRRPYISSTTLIRK